MEAKKIDYSRAKSNGGYKAPSLYIPTNVQDKWYIIFYVKDKVTGKPIRKRMYKGFNNLEETYEERLEKANKLLSNLRLDYMKMELTKAVFAPESYTRSNTTFLKAIEIVRAVKEKNISKARIFEFNTIYNFYETYLGVTKTKDVLAVKFDDKREKQFLDWIISNRTIEPRTLQNYEYTVNSVRNVISKMFEKK